MTITIAQPQNARRLITLERLTCATLAAAMMLAPQVGHAVTESKRLTLQAQMDKQVPLNHAFFPWAHNSFSSSAYGYTNYVNQQETTTQHLDAGLRMIDIDSIWDNTTDQRLEACHGACWGYEKPVTDRFDEIYDWFYDPTYGAERRENEVVLIYLEAAPGDMISNVFQGSDWKFDQLIDDLQSSGLVGADPNWQDGLVYTPVHYNGSTGHCTSFEDFAAHVTKADILAAGKNIVIVGAIDSGLDDTCNTDDYQDVAFKIDISLAFDHTSFNGYPTCSSDSYLGSVDYPGYSKFSSAYNDSATSNHMADMSLVEIDALLGCGVNAVSYEKFVTDSWEHDRLVWSWNGGEPDSASEDCAAMRKGSGSDWGIWDRDCTESNRYACINVNTSEWSITQQHSGPWTDGAQACYEELGLDYQFGVPANGYEYNRLLGVAGNGTTWINFNDRDQEDDWEPMEQFTQAVFTLDDSPDGLMYGTRTVALNNVGASATSNGVLNGAYEFNRSQGDRLMGDLDIELEANLTLSLWFKADTGIDYTSPGRLVEISENGAYLKGTYIFFDDGVVSAACTRQGTKTKYGSVSSSAIYEDGSWHHVAYVVDASTAKLYIDGMLVSEANDTCGDIRDGGNNGGKIAIGGYYHNSTDGFDGIIDEVAIYGVALSEEDVWELGGQSRISARYNSNACLQKADAGWDNGNDIVLWDCSENPSEYKSWTYEETTGYIRSVANPSKCMHKQWGNGNWDNGNPIHVWDCNKGVAENKSWDYDASTGYIKARYNNAKCIHKKYGSNWDNGNPIHLWDCTGGQAANKSWDLY